MPEYTKPYDLSASHEPVRQRFTLKHQEHQHVVPIGAHLAPGTCASFHAQSAFSGKVTLKGTGHSDVILESAIIAGDDVSEKIKEEGIQLNVAQMLVVNLKNTSPGQTHAAYPLLLHLEEGSLAYGKRRFRYFLSSKLVEGTAPDVIHINPGERLLVASTMSERFLTQRWIVHTDAPFGALAINEIRVGNCSQMPSCDPLPAAFFNEEASPMLEGDTANIGTLISMHLENRSRHGIYFRAEVEGLVYKPLEK
jgi:hypothetical protein